MSSQGTLGIVPASRFNLTFGDCLEREVNGRSRRTYFHTLVDDGAKVCSSRRCPRENYNLIPVTELARWRNASLESPRPCRG